MTPERHGVLDLAPEFKNGMDAFVTPGAIAQATTTLRIGTAVLLVTERDPISPSTSVTGSADHFYLRMVHRRRPLEPQRLRSQQKWPIMHIWCNCGLQKQRYPQVTLIR